jgi:hypothetical protein
LAFTTHPAERALDGLIYTFGVRRVISGGRITEQSSRGDLLPMADRQEPEQWFWRSPMKSHTDIPTMSTLSSALGKGCGALADV